MFRMELDLHMQAIRCPVCKEVHEIPRRVLRDPEQLLNYQDDVQHDHRECAADPGNRKLALANRIFRKRVEAETARAAARKAA